MMMCSDCQNYFDLMGHPAKVIITRACYASERMGYVCYDDSSNWEGCVKYLEVKGYLVSTEKSEKTICYKLAPNTAIFNEPGYFCWCHLHVEANDECE